MKNSILTLMGLLFLAGSGFAQAYDDLYYDPSKVKKTVNKQETYTYTDQQGYDNSYAQEDEEYFLDEEDYDYYYTSRIRRFHRPLYGFEFFDPFYVDMSYYDPFFTPGMTVLIYDDPYAYRSFYRRNLWRNNWRFNTWGGINPYRHSFGWNRWDSWNTWGDPWFHPYRSGFSFSFGFGNSWFNRSVWNPYGFGSPFYFTPSWGYGYNYNTFNNVTYNVYNDVRQREVYYGPRSNAATNVPRSNSPRLRTETPGEQTDRALGRRSYGDTGAVNPDRTVNGADVTRTRPNVNSPNVSDPRNPRATGRSSEIDTRRNPSGMNPADARISRGGTFDRTEQRRESTGVRSESSRPQRAPNVYQPSTRTPDRSTGMSSGSRMQSGSGSSNAPRMTAPRTGGSAPSSRPSMSTPSRPNVSSGSAPRPTTGSGGSRKKND